MSSILIDQHQPESFLTSVMSFFVPTVHAEEAAPAESESADVEEISAEDDGGAEEEEEEEPEDPATEIREKCQNSKECAPAAHHFQECSDKVLGGKGWQGEDCVEELFHLMHCVDACAAAPLFKKLA